ncbi:MAG: hypothetical protein [Enterobacter phage ENC20]|nr:MAG: hypothetical protein [Enterobacter phage ENC20]
MTHDEAMKAATRGFKVAPMGKAGFFVYHSAEIGFRRVKVTKLKGCCGSTFWDEDYVATPYELMRVWDIYDKSPMTKVKDFINRALGKSKLKLSSNPA